MWSSIVPFRMYPTMAHVPQLPGLHCRRRLSSTSNSLDYWSRRRSRVFHRPWHRKCERSLKLFLSWGTRSRSTWDIHTSSSSSFLPMAPTEWPRDRSVSDKCTIDPEIHWNFHLLLTTLWRGSVVVLVAKLANSQPHLISKFIRTLNRSMVEQVGDDSCSDLWPLGTEWGGGPVHNSTTQ